MQSRSRWAIVVAFGLVAAACSDDADEPAAPITSTTVTTVATAPSTTTTTEPPPPTYRATIRRTESNVPHITADDLPSVAFGYGYAFAEDHLCSLADAVLGARSERARFLGEEWLATDIAYAAVDLRGRARESLEELDPDVRGVIAGYAAGYNAYLAATGADQVTGWCRGADWVRPIDEVDLTAYYKALTLRASLDPLVDLMVAAEPPDPAVTGDAGDGEALDETALAELLADTDELASNAWAIGPERTAEGTTMLLGNPHFPWQGALRFYEAHLTVPGELDVYGASLLGSPAINIGFNRSVAWSHTVSAGARFTAYTLDLVEGDPTSYRYGDEIRSMTSRDITVEVLRDDGTVEPVTRTIWFSHYGPVIDFPGVGWTPERVLTFRDANADNDEIIPQYLAMNQASSMDELIAAHETHQGIPWVNTIAASADGRIWYADTSATPNLSAAAIDAWLELTETDPFTSIALANQVVLLDGSDPLFEWVDDPRARDPGIVPFADTPQLERSDFVFNANDSYWLTNPDQPLTGFSPLHGSAERQVTNRTRMNAIQLGLSNGDSGADGLFTLDELAESALGNRVLTAEMLVPQVIERCERAGTDAPPLAVQGCLALSDWDLHVNLDSTGAHVWRELISVLGDDMWATPFDPADPVGTPSGLTSVETFAQGPSDTVLDALELAVDRIQQAGIALDAALGDIQWTDRNGVRVPVHGGSGAEGVTNVVGPGDNDTTSEPDIEQPERLFDGSSLTTEGYPIGFGTSFVYVLEFTPEGPRARALLSYGESGDPASPFFSDQTVRFSDKNWRPVEFTEDQIMSDPALVSYEVTGS